MGAVRAMQLRRVMLHMKDLLEDLRAIVPFLPQKKTPVLPFVLGGLGVAIVGGIVATMILSPGTRKRAGAIATEGYDVLHDKLQELSGRATGSVSASPAAPGPAPRANGLAGDVTGP
jgi:hypothetical protein